MEILVNHVAMCWFTVGHIPMRPFREPGVPDCHDNVNSETDSSMVMFVTSIDTNSAISTPVVAPQLFVVHACKLHHQTGGPGLTVTLREPGQLSARKPVVPSSRMADFVSLSWIDVLACAGTPTPVLNLHAACKASCSDTCKPYREAGGDWPTTSDFFCLSSVLGTDDRAVIHRVCCPPGSGRLEPVLSLLSRATPCAAGFLGGATACDLEGPRASMLQLGTPAWDARGCACVPGQTRKLSAGVNWPTIAASSWSPPHADQGNKNSM